MGGYWDKGHACKHSLACMGAPSVKLLRNLLGLAHSTNSVFFGPAFSALGGLVLYLLCSLIKMLDFPLTISLCTDLSHETTEPSPLQTSRFSKENTARCSKFSKNKKRCFKIQFKRNIWPVYQNRTHTLNIVCL